MKQPNPHYIDTNRGVKEFKYISAAETMRPDYLRHRFAEIREELRRYERKLKGEQRR